MPSLIMGPARVVMPRSHRFWRPEAHQKHVPQEGMKATATWSPDRHLGHLGADRGHHAGALVAADARGTST